MLVLTRKSQETVVVGGTEGFEPVLKVIVLDVSGGNVKLGFEVDKSVPVHRGEIWEKIHAGDPQKSKTGGSRPSTAVWNAKAPPCPRNGPSRSIPLPKTAVRVEREYGLLVVDDEPCVLSVLDMKMRHQGFTVWLAASGQEAIDLYKQHGEAIDVVLLDVSMPGLDGPQTLTALQAMNPRIRCCFMTGNPRRFANEQLDSVGISAVFQKPFHLAEVAQTLWELAKQTDYPAIQTSVSCPAMAPVE